MRPHIAGNTRDERHGEGLRLPMRRGLHSSLNQPKPKLRTQARTPSAVKIHSRGSNELCLVQDYQHFGDDPFAKTSSISPTYIKPRKYCSSIVRLYVLFVTWSLLHGGKKQNTHLQHMGLNWRKEIKRKKTPKDTMKISNNFISLQFSFLKLAK